MDISVVEVGFPDLNGYVMHTHIQNHYSASIMFWFRKYVNEPSSIENIHLYLIDAYVTPRGFRDKSLPSKNDFLLVQGGGCLGNDDA